MDSWSYRAYAIEVTAVPLGDITTPSVMIGEVMTMFQGFVLAAYR